jgi:hypothetical protein
MPAMDRYTAAQRPVSGRGLFDLGIKETRLTDAKTEEKLSHFQSFAKGDLIITDRAYGTIAELEYPRERGSDFPQRYRTGAFNLYTEEHERVEVTNFFAELKPGARGEVTLYYQLKGNISRYGYARSGKQKRRRTRGP